MTSDTPQNEGTFVALLAYGGSWPWARPCSGGLLVHPRQVAVLQGVACTGSARGQHACARMLPDVGLAVSMLGGVLVMRGVAMRGYRAVKLPLCAFSGHLVPADRWERYGPLYMSWSYRNGTRAPTLVTDGAWFEDNRALLGGVIAAMTGSNLLLRNSTFIGNRAEVVSALTSPTSGQGAAVFSDGAQRPAIKHRDAAVARSISLRSYARTEGLDTCA